jgi:O-succinylbenzoate synthase
MIVKNIQLTHVRVPLVEAFRISSGTVTEKDGIVVRVETDELVGHGESSPMAGSFYSSDTPESCWRELNEILVPGVAGKSFDSPLAAAECITAMSASNFAKVGLETAFWDIEARTKGKPLYELLGGAATPVESGLAVGLYDNIASMLRTIERYLAADGYKRVKIKIERGRDVELIRAVREAFGDIPLFVDANGAYDLTDVEVFKRLDDFGLLMFEQPFPGPMFEELAELQKQVRTPICLDESLETPNDVLRAISLGSMRIANIKIQRVGGFRAALTIHDLCKERGVPVWVGTMPELGIGQAQAMHLATLPNCLYPTDVEASLRWFRDDIISPLLEVRDGCLYPPSRPGLGFDVDEAKLRQYAA